MKVFRSERKQPRREAYFVLVADGDDTPEFINVTDHLGRQMPFAKPLATCGMRVSPDVVAFSMLRLTKEAAKRARTTELVMPRSVLSRLERRAPKLTVDGDALTVELVVADPPRATDEAASPDAAPAAATDDLGALLDATVSEDTVSEDPASGLPPAKPAATTVTWDLKVSRDDAGVVSIEDTAEDDGVITLPRGAVKASVYLHSPAASRTLAVGFIGHLPSRPGQPETRARVAAQILHMLCRLGEFRVLSGIEDVRIPAPPTARAGWTAVAKPRAVVPVPVLLFSSETATEPYARGQVSVEVDLEHSSGRLVYHLVPDETLAASFDTHRDAISRYVAFSVESALGADNVQALLVDITLGEVAEGRAAEVAEALVPLAHGLCAAPTRVVPLPTSAA